MGILKEFFTNNSLRSILSPQHVWKFGDFFIKFEQIFLSRVERTYFQYKYDKPVDITTENWDALILLDACRYDTFSEVNTLNGTLEQRVSKGSTSSEFIEENFVGKELHDTVYVTANPFVNRIDSDVFHAVVTLFDNWDNERQTVMPDAMVNAVMDVQETYPNKRLIVHFMQPHQPYIGEKGDDIRAKIKEESEQWGWHNPLHEPPSDNITMFDAVRHANIDVTNEDLWEAYRESLEIVLKHVGNVSESLTGKTVISADHGELLGERVHLFERYAHPGKVWRRELRLVPWFIIDSEERKEITSDPPERYDTVEEAELDEKLKHLGYK